MSVFPNPTSEKISVEFDFDPPFRTMYYLTDATGRVLEQGRIETPEREWELELSTKTSGLVLLTVVVEDKFYLTERVIIKQSGVLALYWTGIL